MTAVSPALPPLCKWLLAVQAEALAHTTVLVTPCGSLAALTYLLPPGATAIVMNFYQSTTGAGMCCQQDALNLGYGPLISLHSSTLVYPDESCDVENPTKSSGSGAGANVQLDDAAFWNVDHVTVTYYPIGPEDYEGTSVSYPIPLIVSLDCIIRKWPCEAAFALNSSQMAAAVGRSKIRHYWSCI